MKGCCVATAALSFCSKKFDLQRNLSLKFGYKTRVSYEIMKKVVLFLMFFVSFVLIAGNAPEAIQKEFDQRFPQAGEVIWERQSTKGWIVEFVWQGQNCTAIYSFANTWVETKTQIQLDELPLPVKETLLSFYPDWKIVLANRIENAKGETLYRTAIQLDAKLQEVVLKEEGTLLMVGIE